MHREAWRAEVHGVTKSQTQQSDWTELNWWSINFWSSYCDFSESTAVNQVNMMPVSWSMRMVPFGEDIPFIEGNWVSCNFQ